MAHAATSAAPAAPAAASASASASASAPPAANARGLSSGASAPGAQDAVQVRPGERYSRCNRAACAQRGRCNASCWRPPQRPRQQQQQQPGQTWSARCAAVAAADWLLN
mmetsp:Transcript_4590/g.14823  ORF Transcript_4590/g.14823 Transcript_4590/m.14823 type:complete len:109 (-) Transcript_4590:325-651(-)